MVDFSEWEKETLVKFAHEANERIKELEKDLRTAIDSYRKMVTENARKTD